MYENNRFIKPYLSRLNDAIEVFFLGYPTPAINTLVPSIEGIIRDMGKEMWGQSVGHINASQLLETLTDICKSYISDLVFAGVDWVPDDLRSIKLHECDDEAIQCIQSLIYYIKNSLYQHSDNFDGEHGLNRHSILHGLLPDSEYGSKANFYRLINILNSLHFCAVLSGEVIGSLRHPVRDRKADKLNELYQFLNKKSAVDIAKHRIMSDRLFPVGKN